MHLAFKYIKGRKQAFALYNSLIRAGREVFMTYLPDSSVYYIRFYQ
jgi:hypothetical protein